MKVYLDSSLVLRYILNNDDGIRGIKETDVVGSSDLLIIECKRVLQRERLESHLSDSQYSDAVSLLDTVTDHLYLIELGRTVKRRASGSFPTVIGTLDAIHLASAALWQESDPETELRVLSYDNQLTTCARAIGLQVG